MIACKVNKIAESSSRFLARGLFLITVVPAQWAVADEAPTKPIAVHLYRMGDCGCCVTWAKYLEQQGFTVTVEVVDDLGTIRLRNRIPGQVTACHTAEVEGHVIEGHVSAEEIRAMLNAGTTVRGLLIHGMPKGAPGMEGPDVESYDVMALDPEGNLTVFSKHEAPPDRSVDAPAAAPATATGVAPAQSPQSPATSHR